MTGRLAGGLLLIALLTVIPSAPAAAQEQETELIHVTLHERLPGDEAADLTATLPAGVRLEQVETELLAGSLGFVLTPDRPVREQLEQADEALAAEYRDLIDQIEASGEDVGVPIADLRADLAAVEQDGLRITALTFIAEPGSADAAVAALEPLGTVNRGPADDGGTGLGRILLTGAIPAAALVLAAGAVAWLALRLFRRPDPE